jgi:UDP-N-acetylmuramoyl-tripeptide--D-alanyl-D-alanine ligase
MVATFQEMLTSRRAPALLLIDDSNRGKIPDDDQVIWYGDAPRSEAYLKNVQVSEQGSQGWLHWKNKKREIATRLWGEHQLRNALPGIILTQHLQGKPEVAIIGLRYAPDIPRRLAITRNANGTVLIDNSYNSNPGSWKEMFALLQKLSLPNLALITSGFVELEHDLQTTEHHKLAQELAQVAQTVVIIRTQDNSTLIQELPHLLTDVMIVDSFPEALQALQTSSRPISYLWIEGGSRELYA